MQANNPLLQKFSRSKQLFTMITKLNGEIARYESLLRGAKRPDQVEFLTKEIDTRKVVRRRLNAEYNELLQGMRNRSPSPRAASARAASPRRNNTTVRTKRWGCEGGVCGWLFGSKGTRKLTPEQAAQAPVAAAHAANVATVEAAEAVRAARLAQAAAAQAATAAAINAELNASFAALPRGPALQGSAAALAAELEAQLAAEGPQGQLGQLESEHRALQDELNLGTQRINALTAALVKPHGGTRISSKLRKNRAKKSRSHRN
jgi:hypothetical protein